MLIKVCGRVGILMTVLVFGCSTPGSHEAPRESGPKGVLENIAAIATPNKTTITITVPGDLAERKAYTLTDPPRICVDLKALPKKDLPGRFELSEGPVEKIVVQGRGPGHTGLVVYIRPEEYKYRWIPEKDQIELLVTAMGNQALNVSPAVPSRPEFLEVPRIVALSVTPRSGSGTRVSAETNEPVTADVRLEGKTLLMDFDGVSADPPTLKSLERTSPEGPVTSIEAVSLNGKKGVQLRLSLRFLAPYHVVRTGTGIIVDFDAVPSAASPPERLSVSAPESAGPAGHRVVAPPNPLSKPVSGSRTGQSKSASSEEQHRAKRFESTGKDYAGRRLSLEFRDANIREILRLLADFENLNVVWGSDVAGKISMRLENVPWDQALEMVLKPNELTYQIENDVLWVLPRSKLVDMEIAEKKRKGALMAAKRLQGVFEAKVVEFIVVRHRPVAEIFKMLVGDSTAKPPIRPILDIEGAESEEAEEGEEEKGKKVKIATMDLYLSYDAGTNTIIANGVRAKVDKVKELVSQLDIPEKQVLIEARIVEATTDFARDLGIQWQSLDGTNPGIERKWYNRDGTTRFDGSFSTNAPGGWQPNLGLAFGWLTDGGLGSLALDASLALGQQDGKARIISAPKVLTKNGGEALIERGTVDYYAIRTLDTISYEQIPAVLSLKVVPTVSADNSHVTMDVEVKDDKTLDATQKQSDEGTSESPPGRTTKKVISTLLVKTGDTVVIGGIYQKSELEGDTGVPWLMDIPVLGWLFKANRKQVDQTELLIFLTPTVVSGMKEQKDVGSQGKTF